MKYIVYVEGRQFQVDVEDLDARPIVARVDGEAFDVMPGDEPQLQGGGPPAVEARVEQKPAAAQTHGRSEASANPQQTAGILTAPLPGTITEVFVRPGDVIQTGHVVLIIEAMKMKNSIRAIRGGTVADVLVRAGEAVNHKQALVRFTDGG